MNKMSLKNIKIVIITIIVLFVLILIFKIQIDGMSSSKRTIKYGTSTENAENTENTENAENKITEKNLESNENKSKEAGDEELEVDTEQNETKTEEKQDVKATNLTEDFNLETLKQENDTETQKQNQEGKVKTQEQENQKTNKALEQDITEIQKENREPERTIIQHIQKEKTPQEVFNYALSEMNKGRYNSAIYEFNNAIDIAKDSQMSLKARRYLAQCYEKKGINSEAFDIYEYIYLHTNSKEDLLELNRIAQKTSRGYMAQNYIQMYIDEHPEERESFSKYINY